MYSAALKADEILVKGQKYYLKQGNTEVYQRRH